MGQNEVLSCAAAIHYHPLLVHPWSTMTPTLLARAPASHAGTGSLSPELINEWATAALPSLVPEVKRLVEINSGTENVPGVLKVQRVLADFFSALGMSVELIPQIERAPILRARTKAAQHEQERVVIVGHADTVFEPESEFQSFELDADSTKARGPGIYDMKSGLVVIAHAMHALQMMGRLDATPVEVLINASEEFPTLATCAEMQRLMSGASAALVFEFGRESNSIILERKGMSRFRIDVEGKEAHAGNGFFEGQSAIVEMARIIQELSALSNRDTGLTVNPGLVEAHTPLGVVSGHASFGIELRACSSDHLDRARAVIQGLQTDDSASPSRDGELRRSVQEIEHTPPMEIVPGTFPLFERYVAAGEKAGVEFVRNGRVGGTSDGNLATALGIPTLDALGPQGGGAHTHEEFVLLSSIPQRLAALVHFLVEAK